MDESASVFQEFMRHLNVTTLKQARKLPSGTLMAANVQLLQAAPRTSYMFNPVIDGDFVPASAYELLPQDRFDRSVKFLTGLDSFEGGFFFDPSVKDEVALKTWIEHNLPTLPKPAVEHITTALYPPVFDGSMGYVDCNTRQAEMWSDMVFYCNTEVINEFVDHTCSRQSLQPTKG